MHIQPPLGIQKCSKYLLPACNDYVVAPMHMHAAYSQAAMHACSLQSCNTLSSYRYMEGDILVQ